MQTIREPARDIPVVDDFDLCVLGGSCTGVFAAVAAARQGLKVALVEKHAFFGGVATAGLVNIWHTTKSTDRKIDTIAGLTQEVIERMTRLDAVNHKGFKQWHGSYHLNTEVLKLILDELVTEAGVRPFLHANFAAPVLADGKPVAAIIEDKSGRRAIRAAYFVDATGDGDFVARAGLPTRKAAQLQPPTMCAIWRGLGELGRKFPEYAQGENSFNLRRAIFNPDFPESIPEGNAWWNQVPGSTDETMLAGVRVFKTDCSEADELTQGELRGRRGVYSIMQLLRNQFMDGKGQPLVTIASQIGIRMSRQACCEHQVTQEELLRGHRFEDAIANGTYPVDIHHTDRAGITFRWLDGTEKTKDEDGNDITTRWLPADEEPATYYQIPYRALVPQGASNVLVAGRLTDADPAAFGAIRVMVNCNQTGEAAGTACALACRAGSSVADVDPGALRRTLADNGAIVL